MECPPFRSLSWLHDHAREIERLEVDDAVALIEAAGLTARVMPRSGGRMTEELRQDRIDLWVSEDGSIASLDAG